MGRAVSQSGDQDADGSLLLTSDEVLWALDLVSCAGSSL